MADRFGLVDTTLADRYRVDGLVAEGGYASVAIKVLKTPGKAGLRPTRSAE